MFTVLRPPTIILTYYQAGVKPEKFKETPENAPIQGQTDSLWCFFTPGTYFHQIMPLDRPLNYDILQKRFSF
jgi:hypothetical protein